MSIILVWQNWLECIKLLVATSLKQRGAWKLSASITCLADKICKSNSCHLSLQNCGHWLEMRGMANVALLHFFSFFFVCSTGTAAATDWVGASWKVSSEFVGKNTAKDKCDMCTYENSFDCVEHACLWVGLSPHLLLTMCNIKYTLLRVSPDKLLTFERILQKSLECMKYTSAWGEEGLPF